MHLVLFQFLLSKFEKIKWVNSAIRSYKKDATANSKETFQRQNRSHYWMLERKLLSGTKCLDP